MRLTRSSILSACLALPLISGCVRTFIVNPGVVTRAAEPFTVQIATYDSSTKQWIVAGSAQFPAGTYLVPSTQPAQ